MNCVPGGTSRNTYTNYLYNKKKLFYLSSTSLLGYFMLVLVMTSDTLVLQTLQTLQTLQKFISVESYDMNIKFLQPNRPAAQFFRPSLEDICWIPIHDIITKVDPP